jgi:hypothetical protein
MLNLSSSWLEHNGYRINWLPTILTEFFAFAQVGARWKVANCTYCTCKGDYSVECETKKCPSTPPSRTPPTTLSSTSPTTPSSTPSITQPEYCVDMNGTRYEVIQFELKFKYGTSLITHGNLELVEGPNLIVIFIQVETVNFKIATSLPFCMNVVMLRFKPSNCYGINSDGIKSIRIINICVSS